MLKQNYETNINFSQHHNHNDRKIQLILTFKKPSLLCVASCISYFIAFIKVLPQINNIEIVSRLVALEAKIFSYFPELAL